MRLLPTVLVFLLCCAPAIDAAERYAIRPETPGNAVVYPKRLKVLREVLPSLREKAEDGDSEAQRNLGEKLLMLDEKTEAAKWLKKSAANGNADALYLLGLLADEAKKTDEAVTWFGKSAEKGNTEALVALGDIYLFQRKDPAKSLPFFRQGAERGNANAQQRLAFCYSQGWGVKKNVQKGLEWLKKSAANGLADPMVMLFEIYSEPQPAKLCGVRTNPAKALYWLERATASRSGSGLFELFAILENGKGEIRPDAARGWLWARWALDAIENHDTENIFFNKKELERKAALFQEKMNEEEREKAARALEEWMHNGYPALSATEPE